MMSRWIAVASLLLGITALSRPADAQLIHTATPFQTQSSGYSESSTIGWSLQGKHWFANFGGGGPLLPPLGPALPNTGLSGGVGFAGGGVSGGLGFNFAQASSQSISSTSAALTTMDGYPGSLSSGVIRPFVIGWTPVVGQYTAATRPLQTATQTAAAIGQDQLSALRRSQAVLQNKKLAQYLRRAERAESEGNKRMARANYRCAIAIAPQPLRWQLQQRLRAMMAK